MDSRHPRNSQAVVELHLELRDFRAVVEARFDQQDARLDRHEAILDHHTTILDEHTKTLDEHTKTLDGHTKTLSEHGDQLAGIRAIVEEILRRLPEAS